MYVIPETIFQAIYLTNKNSVATTEAAKTSRTNSTNLTPKTHVKVCRSWCNLACVSTSIQNDGPRKTKTVALCYVIATTVSAMYAYTESATRSWEQRYRDSTWSTLMTLVLWRKMLRGHSVCHTAQWLKRSTAG